MISDPRLSVISLYLLIIPDERMGLLEFWHKPIGGLMTDSIPTATVQNVESSSVSADQSPVPQSPSPPAGRSLPAGYRQGVITAITVIIGFSLSFLRYWTFEAPGNWTPWSIGALIILLLPICAQINTLYRALLIEDDDEDTYRVTIKWFIWSVFGILFAVCLSGVVISLTT